METIYLGSFSFKGPDCPTDKWAAGQCRNSCPNVAKYWLHNGISSCCLFIWMSASIPACSLCYRWCLSQSEFFQWTDFNIWYFCMPNWCLVLCICANVHFMTTVKTHLLWLKFKMISSRLRHWAFFPPLLPHKRKKNDWDFYHPGKF